MNVARNTAASLALFALCACKTTSAQHDVPALVTDPTPESRAEMAQVVSQALNGAPVTLSDDALTQTSELIIERNEPRDSQGRPVSGRDLGKPDHFQLVISDSQCVLIHQANKKRYSLTEGTCVPE